MSIKYPKTEIMIVLGSKVYPLYTSLSVSEVHDFMRVAHREDFLIFLLLLIKNMVTVYGIQDVDQIQFGQIGKLRKMQLNQLLNCQNLR